MPPIPVAKDDVLVALLRMRRLGNNASLIRLERLQPDLAELLMDSTTDLHRRLARTRLPPLTLRRVTRSVENMGITLVDACVIAQLRYVQQHGGLLIPALT